MDELPFQMLSRQWGRRLVELIRDTERDLLICTPFVSRAGTDLVVKHLSEEVRRKGRLTCLTDLSALAVCQRATEPSAIRDLSMSFGDSELVHLPRLHAKVYIADNRSAIVTSGNLTAGGLFNNYEYGLLVKNNIIVESIKTDIMDYSNLGARLDQSEFDRYCDLAEKARTAFEAEAREVLRASRPISRAIKRAEDELIRARLSRGALHSVLARTVVYLLNRHGAMSTENLHTLIEQIHPDLCDNSVDRVIDGKRFGKKWKHAVRSAQQHLKQRGDIEFIGGKWAIRGSS